MNEHPVELTFHGTHFGKCCARFLELSILDIRQKIKQRNRKRFGDFSDLHLLFLAFIPNPYFIYS